MKSNMIRTAAVAMILTLTAAMPVAAGWNQDTRGWKYQSENILEAQSTWLEIENKWYYFDQEGYMKTGWIQDGNAWYYLEGTGNLKTGWLKQDGLWYYLEKNGVMVTGNKTIDKQSYNFDGSGALITGLDNDLLSKVDQSLTKYTNEMNYILNRTNEVRASVGVAPLVWDDKLTEVALYRSFDMNKYNYFDHYKDGSSDMAAFDVCTAMENGKVIGGRQGIGENIAYMEANYNLGDRAQYMAEYFMQAWIDSPGHYENIIHPEFKTFGVGIVIEEGKAYYTQIFGTP